MTAAQLSDIIHRLKQGEELAIRSQDGWWGIRFRSGHFIQWDRTPYTDRADVEVSEADVRKQLASWNYQRLRSRMLSASG